MKWRGLACRQTGFTLIELLIVVSVLGILASGIVSAINPALQIQKGRDFKRKSDISSIQTALEQYRHDQSAYPAALSTLTSGVVYMTTIPSDPVSSNAYNSGKYSYSSTGTTYDLVACLDNKDDTGTGVQSTDPTGVGTVTNCPSSKYYVGTNQ